MPGTLIVVRIGVVTRPVRDALLRIRSGLLLAELGPATGANDAHHARQVPLTPGRRYVSLQESA